MRKTHPNWRLCAPGTVPSRSSRGRHGSPPIFRASAAGCKTARLSCPPSCFYDNCRRMRKTEREEERVELQATEECVSEEETRCHPRADPSRGLSTSFLRRNVGRDRTAPRARAQRKERSIRAPVWRSRCCRALSSGEGWNIERSRPGPTPAREVFTTYPSTTLRRFSPLAPPQRHP